MAHTPLTSPKYGERTVAWQTVWDDLFPEDAGDPHDDAMASDMHRLRGLVMAQGSEVEAVLAVIVELLSPGTRIGGRTAGWLARELKKQLNADQIDQHWTELLVVDKAIDRRNHAVHSPVTIGSSWRDYATGGGEWVPVISLMKGDIYDETDLLRDLAIQQEATIAAVRLLHACREPRPGTQRTSAPSSETTPPAGLTP